MGMKGGSGQGRAERWENPAGYNQNHSRKEEQEEGEGLEEKWKAGWILKALVLRKERGKREQKEQ